MGALTAGNNVPSGASLVNCAVSGTWTAAAGWTLNATSFNAAADPGLFNLRYGSSTLNSTLTGTNNIALGYGVLNHLAAGSYNTAIGSSGLTNLTSGGRNTAIGSQCFPYLTDGNDNLGIGYYVGAGCGTSALRNIGIGSTVLTNVTGNDNIAGGTFSLSSITSGYNNIGIGYKAGVTATPANASVSSHDLVFVGHNSGANTATQINNAIAIGSGATIGISAAWTIGTLGVKQVITEGANAAMGVSVLVAGTVTVANTNVTANSRIFHSRQAAGGTLGNLSIANVIAGTSFDILSDNIADTSTVAWEIKDKQ